MTQAELQKALEAIGKGGITVNGDLVLSKQVENEIGNVEAGGIGIQNVYHHEEPEGGDDPCLPKELDTDNARKYFPKAIERQYMQVTADGKYHWTGTGDRGENAQLAYFLGRVYNYKHTVNGNAGENFPEESLNELFGVKRLYSSLTQVYNAQKRQRWRAKIDALFVQG
jgi:hypothetical protein